MWNTVIGFCVKTPVNQKTTLVNRAIRTIQYTGCGGYFRKNAHVIEKITHYSLETFYFFKIKKHERHGYLGFYSVSVEITVSLHLAQVGASWPFFTGFWFRHT
jgi:hypothetical protein